MSKQAKRLEKERRELKRERDLFLGQPKDCFVDIYKAINTAKKSDMPLHDVLTTVLGSIMVHYELDSLDDLRQSIMATVVDEPTADTPSTDYDTPHAPAAEPPAATTSTTNTPETTTSENHAPISDTPTDDVVSVAIDPTGDTPTEDGVCAAIETIRARQNNANPRKRKATSDLRNPRRRKRDKFDRMMPRSIMMIVCQMRRLELRFCDEVMEEVLDEEHTWCTRWFVMPPDADSEPLDGGIMVKDGAMIIRLDLPIHLFTMEEKNAADAYRGADDVKADFDLMVTHATNRFPEGHIVHEAAKGLRDIVEQKWSEKADWMREKVAAIEKERRGGRGD